jgi:hypothetical protein
MGGKPELEYEGTGERRGVVKPCSLSVRSGAASAFWYLVNIKAGLTHFAKNMFLMTITPNQSLLASPACLSLTAHFPLINPDAKKREEPLRR